MAYRIVEEALNVWSCSIADLKIEQVEAFLKLWNDGSSIGCLTVFYDPETGRVVLNHDHKSYEKNKELCCTYLALAEDMRTRMYEQMEGRPARENLDVLNAAIWKREVRKNLFMLNNQPAVPEKYDIDAGLFGALYDEERHIGISKAFHYGIMQGKRMERDKKRRAV